MKKEEIRSLIVDMGLWNKNSKEGEILSLNLTKEQVTYLAVVLSEHYISL